MRAIALFGALALALVGCGGKSQPGTPANASRFERSVGNGSPADILLHADRILIRHQFEVLQRGDLPNLYIETKWRSRAPFDDEEVLGVLAAQTRAIVRGSRRGSTSRAETYSVNLTIENRVQRDRGGAWYDNVATKQYLEYANQITADLQKQLEIGVRR